jgi:nucleoside-diphosphate-sugar epimerase
MPSRSGERRRAEEAGAEVLEEKRVSNGKLKAELGWRPEFPTYREGLAAILQGDMRPFQQ